MKTYILLTSLILFCSCVAEAPKPEAESAGASTSGSGGGGNNGTGGVVQAVTPAVVRVKNYNQYNQSLEKLTKLPRANYNALFEALKGSLPADNDIGGLTSFNLIAMTRLADGYCADYIERESTAGLNGKINPLRPADVRDFLMTQFLDVDKDEKYLSLKTEVDNVLDNNDGSGAELFPMSTNDLAGNKALAVAACVTVLASPYITLLE